MELRHLRYFVTLAEELHFGRAARRLGIAQPPLSQQLKLLEEEIGALLLVRTRRHVELTAAGRVFLDEAKKTLLQAELARHAAQRAARGETGRLIVGFVSSAAYDKIPSILHRMQAAYPEVTLELQDLTSEEQVEAMNAHRLDVGLVRPPISGTEALALRVIWREPLVVVLPQNHRLAREKTITLEWLAEEAFIQVPRHLGPGFYDQVISVCTQAGFSPRIVHGARTTHTIVSLIAGGLGVSIVPASLQCYQPAAVVYRPIQPPAPVTETAVMWHPEEESPALQSFLKIIHQVSQQPPARP